MVVDEMIVDRQWNDCGQTNGRVVDGQWDGGCEWAVG